MKTKLSLLLRNPFTYLFVITAAVFLYFRFTDLDQRIIFDWDQENYATQIKDLVQNGNFTLLGPRTTNAEGFFLAPYFTYMMAPFYMISNLHPVGGMYFVIFYNILFIGVAMFLLSRLFSTKLALMFIAFWAINFMMIQLDIIPWWPLILPIGILSAFYLLHKTTHEDHEKEWFWWSLTGMNAGFYMNMHFQFIFILLFCAIFYSIHFFHTKKIELKGLIIAIVSFILMFTPLFLFDLRNNFLNTNLFINFFFGGGIDGPTKSYTDWTLVLANFLQPFTAINNLYLSLGFYVFIGVLMAVLSKVSIKNFHKTFFLASVVLWICVPLFFIKYAQRPPEYYFIFILPFIHITLISFFQKKHFTSLLILFIIFTGFANLENIQGKLGKGQFGLAAKDKTIKFIKENYDPTTFTVSFDVDIGREPGFPYLLDYYGLTKNSAENASLPLIEILIPPDEATIKITNEIGLKINPRIKPLQ